MYHLNDHWTTTSMKIGPLEIGLFLSLVSFGFREVVFKLKYEIEYERNFLYKY